MADIIITKTSYPVSSLPEAIQSDTTAIIDKLSKTTKGAAKGIRETSELICKAMDRHKALFSKGGLTQEQWAAAMGVSKGYLSDSLAAYRYTHTSGHAAVDDLWETLTPSIIAPLTSIPAADVDGLIERGVITPALTQRESKAIRRAVKTNGASSLQYIKGWEDGEIAYSDDMPVPVDKPLYDWDIQCVDMGGKSYSLPTAAAEDAAAAVTKAMDAMLDGYDSKTRKEVSHAVLKGGYGLLVVKGTAYTLHATKARTQAELEVESLVTAYKAAGAGAMADAIVRGTPAPQIAAALRAVAGAMGIDLPG